MKKCVDFLRNSPISHYRVSNFAFKSSGNLSIAQIYFKNVPITSSQSAKYRPKNTENWWQKIISALIYEKGSARKKLQENKFIFEFQKIYSPQYFVHNAKTY